MEADFQRRIQRYGWDKAAGYYEACWHQQLAPAQERMLHVAQLKPGEHVLDVACGTGLISLPAAKAIVPNGQVVATDISEGMLEIGERMAVEQGVQNVAYKRMEAEDLEFPESTFDVALCALGLMYVPDYLMALREMHRVLRIGGRAIALVWGARRNCGWAGVFPIVDSRVKSEVCPLFFQLGSHNTLSQAFLEARFEDVTVERINSPLHFSTADEACAAVFAGGPVALAYHRFDDKTREEAHREYLHSIEAYSNGNGYNIPGEFVIAKGVKA